MDLSHLDKAYSETAIESKGKNDLPEGRYEMTVDDVLVFESKDGGRPFLKITLRVASGELTGSKIDKLYALDNPERFKWLKGDLAMCGLICKLSEIGTEGAKIVGVRLQVQAKKNGDYVNYYINGRANSAPVAHSGNVPF